MDLDKFLPQNGSIPFYTILHRKHPTSNPSLDLSLPLVWHNHVDSGKEKERDEEEKKDEVSARQIAEVG